MLLYACKTSAAPCPVLDQYWIESSTIANAADVGITPDQILIVITWGFGVVLMGWVIGYGMGIVVSMLRKL